MIISKLFGTGVRAHHQTVLHKLANQIARSCATTNYTKYAATEHALSNCRPLVIGVTQSARALQGWCALLPAQRPTETNRAD